MRRNAEYRTCNLNHGTKIDLIVLLIIDRSHFLKKGALFMHRFPACLFAFSLMFGPLSAFAVTPNQPRSLCFINTAVRYVDGRSGPYTVTYENFENTAWAGGTPVNVFFPKEQTDPSPVMFFSHGFGGSAWISYGTMIKHLVSRGFIVVYSPYPATAVTDSGLYDIMWNGFQAAAERYASRMNLRKVGFIGHSFGAGAVPAMAWNGLVDKGWGKEGAFLFIMAPAPAMRMTTAQFSSFPKYASMIVQSFNEDTIVDHRWAIDIFTKIGIPDSQKAYYNIVSGAVSPAGHTVPSDSEVNDLDIYAVRTPLDALIDYTFKLSDRACDAKSYGLLGYGEHFQHTVTKNPALP